jgi:Na+-driven multidrug efflux pump
VLGPAGAAWAKLAAKALGMAFTLLMIARRMRAQDAPSELAPEEAR